VEPEQFMVEEIEVTVHGDESQGQAATGQTAPVPTEEDLLSYEQAYEGGSRVATPDINENKSAMPSLAPHEHVKSGLKRSVSDDAEDEVSQEEGSKRTRMEGV